jgi:hypothetical protein
VGKLAVRIERPYFSVPRSCDNHVAAALNAATMSGNRRRFQAEIDSAWSSSTSAVQPHFAEALAEQPIS